jgi:hypothetical protein
MLKKSFLLVLFMTLMGTVVSLGAQEPASSVVSTLFTAGNDTSIGGTQVLPQIAASPLSSVGNDIEIGGPHTLYATYAKYNDTITLKAAGYAQLDDATTVTCPVGGGSCLIEFDQFVEIGSSATDNRWAICSQLDGVFVSAPNCPYQGYADFGGNYFYKVGSSFQFAGSVSPGTHTVQTFVNSDYGLAVGGWSLKYQVYQP